MRKSIVLFGLSLGVAAAAACSSSSSNNSGNNNNNTADAGAGGSDAAVVVVGDSGLTCGTASCAAGEVCCYSRTSPTCTASAAACQGSYLSCSNTASCTGSQVCCFSFTDDSGTGMGPFASQCADSCDAPSYKLCASDSECSNGDTCTMGTYTLYCGTAGGGGFTFDASGFMFDASGFMFDASGFNRDTGTPPSSEAGTGDAGSEAGTDQ